MRSVFFNSILSLGFFALISNINAAETNKGGWEVTSIESKKEGEAPTLTFTKVKKDGTLKKKNQIKITDDDGFLTLTAIHSSIMQKHSNDIVDKKTTWSAVAATQESEYPRFRKSLLSALQRVKDYTESLNKDLLAELKKINSRLEEIKKEADPAKTKDELSTLLARQIEINLYMPIMTAEHAKADVMLDHYTRNETLTVKELSETLGVFLNDFGKEHYFDSEDSQGKKELIQILDPESKHSLAQTFTGRPFVIRGDGIKIREPRTNITFASGVFDEKLDPESAAEITIKKALNGVHSVLSEKYK